jgi:hypothetical protein
VGVRENVLGATDPLQSRDQFACHAGKYRLLFSFRDVGAAQSSLSSPSPAG